MIMYAIDSIAIQSGDGDRDDTQPKEAGDDIRNSAQQRRRIMCHQQTPGFSLIFSHWTARHCYY
jgi:hypothetical protein